MFPTFLPLINVPSMKRFSYWSACTLNQVVPAAAITATTASRQTISTTYFLFMKPHSPFCSTPSCGRDQVLPADLFGSVPLKSDCNGSVPKLPSATDLPPNFRLQRICPSTSVRSVHRRPSMIKRILSHFPYKKKPSRKRNEPVPPAPYQGYFPAEQPAQVYNL